MFSVTKQVLSCCTVFCLIVLSPAFAKDKPHNSFAQSFAPAVQSVAQDTGNIYMGVANNGTFSNGFTAGLNDPFTGEPVGYSQFPKNSGNRFLFAGALWVGAVVGRDTLVSVGADGWVNAMELNPDEVPAGNIQQNFIENGESYTLVYYDTLTAGIPNDYTGRPHVPLPIKVTQTSYSWNYPGYEDIIILDYKIKNIGDSTLHDFICGFLMDYDVFNASVSNGYSDDLTGYLDPMNINLGCDTEIPYGIAYVIDNDGDPVGGVYGATSSTDAVGFMLLAFPMEEPSISYNWWISNTSSTYDFGPRERSNVGSWEEPFRDFGTGGLGTPMGDQNKYYLLHNREIDYNQWYTSSIQPNDTLWLEPSVTIADDYSTGADTRFLLSFGPVGEVNPNEEYPLTVAIVGGRNIHTDPTNINNLPDNPEAYSANLDFSDLLDNARKAMKVYDMPGKDTDGDAYTGIWEICNGDTVYISGDHVPDLVLPPCCVGRRGNVNFDEGDVLDISDLLFLVDYLFTSGAEAPFCEEEANVDGLGTIDISDLTYMVDFMFVNPGMLPPADCP